MNILFTESSPNIGGQELQAVAQMKALKKMGHLILPSNSGHAAK